MAPMVLNVRLGVCVCLLVCLFDSIIFFLASDKEKMWRNK